MNEQATPAQPVSLATLMTPSKTVSIDYPEMDGFSVDLTFLARDEILKLRNKCLKQKFNKKTRAFEEQLDEDTFLTEYVKVIIKGWSGFKYKYLEEMMLIDTTSLDLDRVTSHDIGSQSHIAFQFDRSLCPLAETSPLPALCGYRLYGHQHKCSLRMLHPSIGPESSHDPGVGLEI